MAVLDTNVVVSALLSPSGPPAALLAAWRDHRFDVLSSVSTLAELAAVVERPRIVRRLSLSRVERLAFLDEFARVTIAVEPDRTITAIAEDPADNRFLELAIAGRAEYIVSGDRHLAALGEFEGIPVVSPARFVAILDAT